MDLIPGKQYIITTIQRTRRVNRKAWTNKKQVEEKMIYKGIENNRLIFETEKQTELMIPENNIIKIIETK